EEIDVSAGLAKLREGTNCLAVELLGSSTNDVTAGFTAELLANLTRGPLVQNTTSNSVQIIWKTLRPEEAFIEYGTNTGSAARMELAGGETNHVATLTNLEPD